MKVSEKTSGILKSIGPGLLMAGAAIGGSHLVQSTRAGADYGLIMAWVILAANLFKYPFFEYGPRYVSATGKSLFQGYQSLGTWAVWIFGLFTLGTMFIIEAALLTVSGGLIGSLLGVDLSIFWLSLIVVTLCIFLLWIGRYPLLDLVMKWILAILSVSTIAAILALVFKGVRIPVAVDPLPVLSITGISFTVALMGWMPSIVDLSVWHSLWSLEKIEQTGYRPQLREALFDFNLGYILTTLTAFAFLILGTLVMFGSGQSFSNNSVTFANQIVALYTRSLGSWAAPLIKVAAFTTMFSTVLTVTDAYPRLVRHMAEMLVPQWTRRQGHENLYRYLILILALVALVIIEFLAKGIKGMIDLATTLSFLTTPVLAWMNYKVITGSTVPDFAQPRIGMRILSWLGLIFWTGFALVFIYIRLT